MDTATNCLNCYFPFLLYDSALTLGVVTCVGACPSHYYADLSGNDTCLQCDPNCLECNTVPTNCTSCNPTFYFYLNICYNPCPAETYPDATTIPQCIPCNNLCTVCAYTPTNCTVCDTVAPYISYLKEGTTCVANCGFQYFPSAAPPNVCIACDTKCKVCTSSPTNCSSCNPGYYLIGILC